MIKEEVIKMIGKEMDRRENIIKNLKNELERFAILGAKE